MNRFDSVKLACWIFGFLKLSITPWCGRGDRLTVRTLSLYLSVFWRRVEWQTQSWWLSLLVLRLVRLAFQLSLGNDVAGSINVKQISPIQYWWFLVLFCNKKVNGPSANGLFSEDSWGPTGPVQRLCLSVSLSSLTPIGFKQKVYSLCLFVFLLLLLLYPYQLDPLQPIWVPLSDICTLVYKCACYP